MEKLSMDKFKAIIGLATDKAATDFIQQLIKDEGLLIKDFSYNYHVLIERHSVALEVHYSNTKILDTTYFYDIVGALDGAIKISLSTSHDEEFLTLEFEPEYDFDSLINQRNK